MGGTVQPKSVTPRRGNPESRGARLLESDAQLRSAGRLLEEFSGHKPVEVVRAETGLQKGLVIGELDGVLYTTVRDGQTERYIHKFRKNSRPLLAASSDGKKLGIVGGQFQFTEAGIEDR